MADERALLMAIPLRHLASASVAVVLPAGGPGDLATAPRGTPLYLIATDAGDREVPAATWHATFVRRVPFEPGSPWPDGLPATWVEEHPLAEVAEAPPPPDSEPDDEDEEYDEDDDDGVGPQSFLEVEQLQELPRQDWLFTNELVRKQDRRGRSFRPRVPTLVTLPD